MDWMEADEQDPLEHLSRDSILSTRDKLLDLIGRRTRDKLAESLMDWAGHTATIDRECFHLLAGDLLGSKAYPPEIDAIFDSLDEYCQGHVKFEKLYRRARNEDIFVGKQKLTLRAGNAFGNRQLQRFENNYRKKTNAHVRTHSRIAVGEIEAEEDKRVAGITMHHHFELDTLRRRYGRTHDLYERLGLPMPGSAPHHLPTHASAALRTSSSAGALATPFGSRRGILPTLGSPNLPRVATAASMMHSTPVRQQQSTVSGVTSHTEPIVTENRAVTPIIFGAKRHGLAMSQSAPKVPYPQLESKYGYLEVHPVHR